MTCPYCDGSHDWGRCPRIKSIDYAVDGPNGDSYKVEFWPNNVGAARMTDTLTIEIDSEVIKNIAQTAIDEKFNSIAKELMSQIDEWKASHPQSSDF